MPPRRLSCAAHVCAQKCAVGPEYSSTGPSCEEPAHSVALFILRIRVSEVFSGSGSWYHVHAKAGWAVTRGAACRWLRRLCGGVLCAQVQGTEGEIVIDGFAGGLRLCATWPPPRPSRRPAALLLSPDAKPPLPPLARCPSQCLLVTRFGVAATPWSTAPCTAPISTRASKAWLVGTQATLASCSTSPRCAATREAPSRRHVFLAPRALAAPAHCSRGRARCACGRLR